MNKAMPAWMTEPTGARILRCASVLRDKGFIGDDIYSQIEKGVTARSEGQPHQIDYINLPLSADPIRAELEQLRATHQTRAENYGNTPALAWTSDKPRIQGCYWLRVSGCAGGREIVRIKADPSTKQLFVHEHGDKRHYKLSGYANSCEWYGPIPEPA